MGKSFLVRAEPGGSVDAAAAAAIVTTAQRRPVYVYAASTTLQLAHAGAIVALSTAAASTATIPADSTLDFPVGSTVEITQGSTGAVSIAGAAGVALTFLPGKTATIAGQNGIVRALKLAANTWRLSGDLVDPVNDQATKPILRLRRATAQQIPTSTFTSLVWDTADIDTAGAWSSGATATIRRSGHYRVSAQVAFLNPITQRLFVVVMKNGGMSTVGRGQPAGGIAETGANTTGTLYLAAGETLGVQVYMDHGSTQPTNFSPYSGTFLDAEWLRY